jgi:hypothetical protein
VASPFGCRSGHIPLSRKPPCPGTGRLARASALLLMHRQRSITIRDGQHIPCSGALAIVLHLVNPLWAGRRAIGGDGRQGSMKPEGTGTRQHAGQITTAAKSESSSPQLILKSPFLNPNARHFQPISQGER